VKICTLLVFGVAAHSDAEWPPCGQWPLCTQVIGGTIRTVCWLSRYTSLLVVESGGKLHDSLERSELTDVNNLYVRKSKLLMILAALWQMIPSRLTVAASAPPGRRSYSNGPGSY
jgi:hypothetical protein